MLITRGSSRRRLRPTGVAMVAQMAHPCKSAEKTPGKAPVLQEGPCESHKKKRPAAGR